MKFEIWSEGYLATGMEGRPEPARMLATIEADTFDSAVAKYVDQLPKDRASYFKRNSRGEWRDWGCRLFQDEEHARKSFG